MTLAIIKQAQSYLGVQQGSKRHQDLIRKYNAVKPLPQGYLMKEKDDWCAAFVTVMADLSGCAEMIGRECGVHRFTQLFKGKKIWRGLKKPKAGDILVFDWRKNGWMDHIGLVENFSGNKVTVIEGNSSNRVARRIYNWNDWRVAGYARPKYSMEKGKKEIKKIAQEVIAGKWANGKERVNNLKKAGYDLKQVQTEVNQQLRAKKKAGKSNQVIAKEVLRGDWGNGVQRKKRLEAAGYDYQKIQRIVNQS
ncbi:MAG: CHAP domain-containing protein [Atopostipes sp.]|nr:CHAP domain-containing protein [Atopostipes sp.]